MADVHSKSVRSYNMSMIKGKNTKPEIIVRKFLFSKGFRYRLHDKLLEGKPDIVLPKYHTVKFINGCFWQGHDNCKYHVLPKTNTDWWLNKINRNIANDKHSVLSLQENGRKVITIWECDLKGDMANILLENLSQNIKLNG